MWVPAWRFIVLAAYAYWQGGFLFYTAEVVPIGTEVLGSPARQGFITRQVTLRMNKAGAVAMGIFALDLFVSRGRSKRRHVGRIVAWTSMAVLLAVLFFLHGQLHALLDPEEQEILDYRAFYPLHRLYLWASAAQWFLGLIYLGLGLWAWREHDERRSNPL